MRKFTDGGVSPLFGIALISAFVLSLEISLTRIFSAVLRYHFVFLVVSMAICGLGIGAMCYVFLKKKKLFHFGLAVNLSAWSSILFLVIFFKVILPVCPESLTFITAVAVLPFIFSGMCIASLFEEQPERANILYAFDLVGAGLASSLTVFILNFAGAVNSSISAAAVGLAAGILHGRGKSRTVSAVGLFMITILFAFNMRYDLFSIPRMPTDDTGYAKELFAGNGKGIKIIHTEWDAFARTDVVKDDSMGNNILLVYTNGQVPTRLIRYDKKSNTYCQGANIADLPFAVQKPEKVLCIGPGGGMDVIIAERHGAVHIDGVEINPAIWKIMHLKSTVMFAGKPYSMKGVNLYTEDGRSFVRNTAGRYDMIFMSLTKTGTGTVGISLVEGYIYTVEAFEDYLNKLNPGGSVVFVSDNYMMNIRLFATALETIMKTEKVPLTKALKHIVLTALPEYERTVDPYAYALIINKQPLSPKAAGVLMKQCLHKKYVPLFIPGIAASADFRPLYRKGATVEYFLSCYYDSWKAGIIRKFNVKNPETVPEIILAPVTDDCPFFLDFSAGIPRMLLPLLTVSFVLLLTLSGGLYLSEYLTSDKRETKTALRIPVLSAYFAFLGAAFMMVEIPLIQKMILILGHPTYALSVVLFFMLSGAGLGSFISSSLQENGGGSFNKAVCFAAAAASFILLLYMNTSHTFILSSSVPLRIIWGGLISMTVGVFLGMPFPVALSVLGSTDKRYIPWMWGINGVASLCGSILAAAGAKLYGFHMVFMAGALFYLFAALSASDRWKKNNPPEKTA